MAGSNETAWAGVAAKITAIVDQRSTEYDAHTIMNAYEFLDLLRRQNAPVPEIGPGYWPTFSITWDTSGAENLEIEVFKDRLEVYRFFDGRTDIWNEPHLPGARFSPKLLAELPRP
jgi:hypothetical protein